MTEPQVQESTREHPSVGPWHALKQLLDHGLVANTERPPEATLDEHLTARRDTAALVAKAALQVVDAIDRNP